MEPISGSWQIPLNMSRLVWRLCGCCCSVQDAHWHGLELLCIVSHMPDAPRGGKLAAEAQPKHSSAGADGLCRPGANSHDGHHEAAGGGTEADRLLRKVPDLRSVQIWLSGGAPLAALMS